MSDEPIYIPPLVPVFPLPEVVLFPRALLPLHVFEPRYRALAADALLGARVIAVALLKPGYEPLYHTARAPLHPVVGVGRIVEWSQAPDGTYDILLGGEARARLIEELPGRPYRLGRVELIEPSCHGDDRTVRELRLGLRGALAAMLEDQPEAGRRCLALIESHLDLGALADMLASALPLIPEVRQSLLAEGDAVRRATRLLEHVHLLAALSRRKRERVRVHGRGLN